MQQEDERSPFHSKMFKGNVLFAFVRQGRGLVHFHFKIIIFSSDAFRTKGAHTKVQKWNILRINQRKKGPCASNRIFT